MLTLDSHGIVTLTLDAPKSYNALSQSFMTRLTNDLRSIADDRHAKVVIVRGEGRGFCAGHDLKEILATHDRAFYESLMASCTELMAVVRSLSQPVIAQVHGVATAAGCQLVATCDLAVAASDARFATPGVLIGLFCSTPMVALSRNVLTKNAFKMLVTGDMISANEAKDFGLINDVVAPEQLSETVDALAKKIASKSSTVIALGKKAFYQQLEMPLDQAYAECAKVMVGNLLDPNAREGIAAFVEKREPNWIDRE
jgi:enoyl-CoA hydratase/carnithine racemase